MKGKKSLILASIFAGISLVGATFAAWAITDNADPLGFKISPGTISTDSAEFVTLSYGEKYYGNVENLAIGQNRLAARIGLIADTSEGHAYTGHFDVTLIDQTTGKGTSDPKLIDYLKINVYDETITADSSGVVTTDVSSIEAKGTLDGTHLTKSINVPVTDGVEQKMYITASLPNTITTTVMDEIKSDVVYLQFDWNSNGVDEVTTSTVYFKYDNNTGKDVYCYAWTAGKVNDDFPGVKMHEEATAGLYSYELSMEYTNLLFVDYTGSVEVYKTADLELTTLARTTTPCYTKSGESGGSWTVVPETLDAGYYLVGSINSWTPSSDYKLTLDTANDKHYYINGVQLAEGNKLKVRDASGEHWYSSTKWEGESCLFDNDSDGNVVVTTTGVYTVHLYLDETAVAENHYILLTK